MNVKFVALRVIWTLGGQICILGAFKPSETDCIVLDIEGLSESLMGLGESSLILPQTLLISSGVLTRKKTQPSGFVRNLKINVLDEFQDELNEFKAIS